MSLVVFIPYIDLTGRNNVTGLDQAMVVDASYVSVFLGNSATLISRQEIG